MDYHGQKLCEYIYSLITIICGTVAWIVGYYKGEFIYTFYGWAIGLGLSLVLCIPDWPMYNRNKVIWMDEVEEKLASKNKGKQSSNKSQKKVADKKQ